MTTRRTFIAGLGGAAAWPIGARAQSERRVQRIGVLMPFASSDQQYKARVGAFIQALQTLGRIEGRNVQIEYRASAGEPDELRRYATELVGLSPAVILTTGVSTVMPLQQATRTIPIVFVVVPDPVGAGIVESLGRPGGNLTGFTTFEYGLSGKWLELLKEVAPVVKRVAVLRNATVSAGIGQLAAIQSVAPSLGVELTPMNVRDGAEIERAVSAFAGTPERGLIVTGSALAASHLDLLVRLMAEHDLHTSWRNAVERSGLEGEVIPHTLRHSRATRLMQVGSDPFEAAGSLGMSVQTLLRTYGHHHPDFQKNVADVR